MRRSEATARTTSEQSTVACSFSLSRFALIVRQASRSESTRTARAAPRLSASSPSAPEPAKRSSTAASSTGPTRLNALSRTRSDVGPGVAALRCRDPVAPMGAGDDPQWSEKVTLTTAVDVPALRVRARPVLGRTPVSSLNHADCVWATSPGRFVHRRCGPRRRSVSRAIPTPSRRVSRPCLGSGPSRDRPARATHSAAACREVGAVDVLRATAACSGMRAPRVRRNALRARLSDAGDRRATRLDRDRRRSRISRRAGRRVTCVLRSPVSSRSMPAWSRQLVAGARTASLGRVADRRNGPRIAERARPHRRSRSTGPQRPSTRRASRGARPGSRIQEAPASSRRTAMPTETSLAVRDQVSAARSRLPEAAAVPRSIGPVAPRPKAASPHEPRRRRVVSPRPMPGRSQPPRDEAPRRASGGPETRGRRDRRPRGCPRHRCTRLAATGLRASSEVGRARGARSNAVRRRDQRDQDERSRVADHEVTDDSLSLPLHSSRSE